MFEMAPEASEQGRVSRLEESHERRDGRWERAGPGSRQRKVGCTMSGLAGCGTLELLHCMHQTYKTEPAQRQSWLNGRGQCTACEVRTGSYEG